MIEKNCKKDLERNRTAIRLFAAVFSALILVSALASGGAGAYAGRDAAQFSDVPKEHWAYDEINRAVQAGAANGYPDGSFKPSSNITYGEFIKMLYAAADGSELVDKMPKEHWAAPYYYAALADGYFDGDSIEIGLIEKEIPRKHMAHMVAGAVKNIRERIVGTDAGGKLLSDKDFNIRANSSKNFEFADVLPAGEYAYDIEIACSSGILTGYPDGTFGGSRTLTRAEAVTVIGRVAEYKEKSAEQIANISDAGGQDNAAAKKAIDNEPLDGKKSGQKIVRKVEKADRSISVLYEVIDSTFEKKGILKIEQTAENTVKIYSAIKYPFIKIMKKDGSLMKSIVSPDGSFFEEEGMFVYVVDPEGQEMRAKDGDLYMLFDDEAGRVYRFSDK